MNDKLDTLVMNSGLNCRCPSCVSRLRELLDEAVALTRTEERERAVKIVQDEIDGGVESKFNDTVLSGLIAAIRKED